jgi:hypothetical protein
MPLSDIELKKWPSSGALPARISTSATQHGWSGAADHSTQMPSTRPAPVGIRETSTGPSRPLNLLDGVPLARTAVALEESRSERTQ